MESSVKSNGRRASKAAMRLLMAVSSPTSMPQTSTKCIDAVTISQYLGRGLTSRGRMTLTTGLDTIVSTLPYLRDQNDVDAVIQGIKNLQTALKGTGLNWTYPAPNTTIEEFVNNVSSSLST